MIFTVLWTPAAERELTELCVAHYGQDLGAISAAADRIDELLRRDPQNQGSSSFDVVRSLHVPPLHVDFEVDVGDRKVFVLTVWHESG
jgi:plasmid stabilization system protein ParE